MIKDKKFLIECTCGCSVLSIAKWSDGVFPDEYIISLYSSTFYEKQNPIWYNIKDRLKHIWCAITGKEYYFYDIVVDMDRLEEFKKFVNDPF